MRISRWHSGKESTCHCRRPKRHGFDPWVGKTSWSRKWQPTPVFSSGKFHREACQALVHMFTQNQILLSDSASMHKCTGHSLFILVLKGSTIILRANFSKESTDVRRQSNDIFKKPKEIRPTNNSIPTERKYASKLKVKKSNFQTNNC